MSSATDILDTPSPVAAPKGAADDLLSQMAGDEINRLLSDAELEPTGTQPPAPEKTALDSALENSPATPPADTVSKELDQVFAQQTGTPQDAAAASESTPAAVEAEPAHALPADGVAELLGSLSAGPATPVDAPAPSAMAPATAEPSPSANSTVVELKTPNPLVESRWSRILDAISLPLDPFPDGVRDVIGKVAIVTAINAVAVWAYIMIFK